VSADGEHMARILFAWEFGANFGHLAQLLPLAAKLRSRGHQPVFAVTDVARAEETLGADGFEYLQAPMWRPRPPRPSVIPCSYSEILQHYGYLDPDGLLGLVKAWREIYRLVDPHVVLFEHAPTALLASRGFEAVRIIYGVGFCSPPRVSPFPSFRTWEDVPRLRLEASDAQVLDTVNVVLAKLRLRPLDALHELFEGDHEFLCTFPELDHYASRSAAQYSGAVFTRNEGDAAEWPQGGGKRVFVYLRPGMRAFGPVAEALADSGHSVLWIAPGVSDDTVKRYASHNLRFAREPVRLSGVATEAHAAVLYGSHGTVAAMLLGGVPVALFPAHVEQALLSRNVVRMGAGTMATPQASVPEMRKSLASVLDEPSFRERAGAFAHRYRHFDPKNVVARIARCVSEHCAQRGASA